MNNDAFSAIAEELKKGNGPTGRKKTRISGTGGIRANDLRNILSLLYPTDCACELQLQGQIGAGRG